jgi:hypothetical protein
MLKFQTTEDKLQVMGSFDIKDHLKSLGAKWNPDARSWDLPIAMDTPEFREVLKETLKITRKAAKDLKEKEDRERRAFESTPEGKAAVREKRIAQNRAWKKEDEERIARGEAPLVWWINCDECEVIDWKIKMTSCDACADDHGFFKETIRVKGGRYTGT